MDMSSSAVSSSVRPTMKPSKARRCLFGPVDHDLVRNDLDSMLQDTPTKNDWNYNFEKDTPLSSGRFEWTEVNASQEYVPAFYCKGYTTRQPPTPRKMNIPRPSQEINSSVSLKKPTAVRQLDSLFMDSEDSQTNSRSSMLSSSVSFSSIRPPNTPTRTPSRSRRCTRNEVDTPLQSLRITDFMSVRKRRNDCDTASSGQRKLPRFDWDDMGI